MADERRREPSDDLRFVRYDHIDAMEADDGALRLYRRRGLFGVLRRQDVFHPPGEWLTVMWHPSGTVQVTLARRTGSS